MNDISMVKYNLYYLLRDLCQDYTILLAEEGPERINGDTIFIHSIGVDNAPLQLGGGVFRSVGFMLDVFSSNGIIHDDNVSNILDRFYSAGSVIYDFNPIGGESNFPYEPPESNTANPYYTPTSYGWMDFVESSSTDLLEEEIDKTVYARTAISIDVLYAKE